MRPLVAALLLVPTLANAQQVTRTVGAVTFRVDTRYALPSDPRDDRRATISPPGSA